MRKLSLIVILPLMFFAGDQKRNTNYIMLTYQGGVVDKPIPMIVFHLDSFVGSNSNDSSYFFGAAYKVNKCEFLSIKNEIEQSNEVKKIDTTDFGYYNFKIVNGNQKCLYIAEDRKRTKNMFNQILSQVSKFKEYNSVKTYFEAIIARIK